METRFTLFDTPLGACALVWGEHGVVGVLLPEASEDQTRARATRRFDGARESAPSAVMQRLIDRVKGLLGSRSGDDLADVELDLRAVSAFHQRVYELARQIPPGATRTYAELALDLGAPHAARSVGQALGANPFPIVVPCHRVLAAGHRAGGFSAPRGARTKLHLLELKGAPLGDAPGLFDR